MESDSHRAIAQHRDKLYGVPFIAKDNYNTAGIATTGESVALLHLVSIPSSAVVIPPQSLTY